MGIPWLHACDRAGFCLGSCLLGRSFVALDSPALVLRRMFHEIDDTMRCSGVVALRFQSVRPVAAVAGSLVAALAA